MSTNSAIEWTESTWNPVAGCTPVSPGCLNCYAATMSHRLDGMGQEKYRGLTVLRNGVRTFNGKISFDEKALGIPLKRKKPTVYFVNSMSDLFHEEVPTSFIQRVLFTIQKCPQHTFQVLTKRPERLGDEMNRWAYGCGHGVMPNLWLGCSPVNQKTYDEYKPHLLRTPAAVRFYSLEPLLGRIDLGDEFWESGNRVEWVIVGGESGPGARPCDVEWVRSIVDQCREAGVACFVKQMGAVPHLRKEFDRDTHHGEHEWPIGTFFGTAPGLLRTEWQGRWVHLKDKKGGDPAEWPDDLRVREMPVVASSPPPSPVVPADL